MGAYFGVKTKKLNSERQENYNRKLLKVMTFPRSNASISKEMNELKVLN